MSGGYAQNNVIGSGLYSTNNGHSISGTASLAAADWRNVVNVQLGLHAPSPELQQRGKSYLRLPIRTGYLFQSHISSPERWEDKSWLTISKRKVRKVSTCSIICVWCAVATSIF